MQVTEILDNAIDEVQAGHASTVQARHLRHYSNCLPLPPNSA